MCMYVRLMNMWKIYIANIQNIYIAQIEVNIPLLFRLKITTHSIRLYVIFFHQKLTKLKAKKMYNYLYRMAST